MGGLTAAEVFAHRLEQVAKRQGFVNPDGSLNKSRLGREADPGNPERGRRRVLRHLSGKHLPSEASRDGYAKALDVDKSELPLPSDEEGEATVEAMVREAEVLTKRASGLAARALRAMGTAA